jgi:hypothetical protein
MSADTLSMIAGAILSLACSYLPGLYEQFERLTPVGKRLVMLCLLVLVATGSYGLACAGWGAGLGLELACDQAGALGLARALILAIVANQGAFLLSPKFRCTTDLAARRNHASGGISPGKE